VPLEQLAERRREEGLVADFYRVTDRDVVARGQAASAAHPLVVPSGEPRRLGGRSREAREKLREAAEVERHQRGELPEHRPEPIAEREQP
jgi:hypothetical protein